MTLAIPFSLKTRPVYCNPAVCCITVSRAELFNHQRGNVRAGPKEEEGHVTGYRNSPRPCCETGAFLLSRRFIRLDGHNPSFITHQVCFSSRTNLSSNHINGGLPCYSTSWCGDRDFRATLANIISVETHCSKVGWKVIEISIAEPFSSTLMPSKI